jgi:hypothetical protein
VNRSTKNRSFTHERYVKLRYWLLRSASWKSLPALPRALYLDIVMRYNGSNNGRISYSVREGAAALSVTKDTIARALKLLQERGFIVCTKVAYFTVKTTREASEWRLTEYDDDVIHQHATKNFMSWQPPEPDTNEKIQFRKRSDRRDRTVRLQGPHGPTRRTVKRKFRPNGPITGTVEVQNPASTVRSEGHLYLPGTGCELGGRLRWSTPSVRELTDRQELRAARSAIAIAEIAARRRNLQGAY